MFTIKQVRHDRQALERLIREHRILKEAVQQSPLNFCVYDQNDCLVAWNKAYEELHPEAFAENREAAEKGELTYERLIRYQIEQQYPEDQVEDEVSRLVACQRIATGEAVVRSYPSAGYLKVCKYPLPSGTMAGLAFEINDQKQSQKQLEDQARALERANEDIRQQALTDALTGLRNRRYVDEYFPEVIAKASKSGSRVALLHIDLDRFKPINDTIGHAAGDHVLRETASILRKANRECDFIARVGGDEFVIVLVGSCSDQSLKEIAETIIHRLSQPTYYEGQICRISASIGIAAEAASQIERDTSLLVRADIALNQAKKDGRSCVRFFNAELQTKLRRKKTIADEIIAGIEQHEFFPVFQPQFIAETEEICGLEVLCRWRHPYRGILMPDEFIKVAKEMALMPAIDRLLAEDTLTFLKQLQTHQLQIPKIAFNVDNRRLVDPRLVNQLTNLQRLGIDVAVELVETMPLDTLDKNSNWSINLLKERGFSIEIDDFGSCHASIAGLMSVAPNAMKIDQRIVSPIVGSEPCRKLVRAIVEIGRALDIEIIAEGAETDAHVKLLRSFGCHVLQGFALAPPMQITALQSFMTDQAHRVKSPPKATDKSSQNQSTCRRTRSAQEAKIVLS